MPTVNALIETLGSCPCCRAGVSSRSRAEDGIPDGMHFEAAFQCGARVFVTDEARFNVGAGCPYPLDERLEEIFDDADSDEAEEA